MDMDGKVLLTAGDMSGPLTSDTFELDNMLHFGATAVWTGTPTGTLYLEVSSELGGASNWEEAASVALSGAAGSQLWLDRNTPYIWLRFRYAFTGGTGLLNCQITSKGNK